MAQKIWQHCLGKLVEEVSEDHFDTYIRPLQVKIEDASASLLAPNIYVEEQVRMAYLPRIAELLSEAAGLDEQFDISLAVGDR